METLSTIYIHYSVTLDASLNIYVPKVDEIQLGSFDPKHMRWVFTRLPNMATTNPKLLLETLLHMLFYLIVYTWGGDKN
jgi:hypothetical protein